MKLSGLDAGLQECTFGTFSLQGVGLIPAQLQSLKTAFSCALEFAQHPQELEKPWLFLQGGYGCGKTHLAAAIANFLIGEGKPALFVNTPDLLDHLRGTYAPDSDVSYDEQFERIRNVSVLILDDLGTQNNTEWAKEKLYQIINYRYNNRLPTVFTTNQMLEDIEPRIRSRLMDKELVARVQILSHDFRRPFAEREMTELSSLNLHRNQTFKNFRTNVPTAKDRGNLERALSLAQEFAESPNGWLVFYSEGIFGNGKTHLAAAIANHLTYQGRSVLFVFVPDLLDHLRSTFDKASKARYDIRFNEIKKAPILVLDDLGIESLTDWAREKIYQLFNYRYNANLITIITTSKNPKTQIDPKIATLMLNGRFEYPFKITAGPYNFNI